MQLSARALGRTLLLRQHLLTRSDTTPLEMTHHLVGLQAQDVLPPYLSLAARVEDFDPLTLSSALETRDAVRFFTMRGTIHLLTPGDALALRAWVQPFLDRVARSNAQSRPAVHLDRADVERVVREAMAEGPIGVRDLKAYLDGAFDEPGDAVLHVAREWLPLVQVPPRGLWRTPGGVTYAFVEDWLGEPQTELDLPELVRRYLTAYGPATAADMTTWSGVTRLGPVFAAMADELERHEDAAGKPLYDVPGAPLADEEVPAPVRLLGKYDNVWLSHAARDRVVHGEARQRWMGPNGGVGNVLLVDGAMAGTWRVDDGEVVVDPWRRLTRPERADLDDETDRLRHLLAVPSHR